MSERLTQPSPFDGGMTYGGIGVVPRRMQDPILSGLADAAARLIGTSAYGGMGASNLLLSNFGMLNAGTFGLYDVRYAGLAAAVQTMPLRLLRVLLSQDGTAQMAAGIEAALGFGAGKVRFVAVKDWQNGKGTIDDSMTAEINRVFALYGAQENRAAGIGEGALGSLPFNAASPPPSLPPAMPLLMHGAERINSTGQICFEAIGDVGVGVTAIYDFDPLTCRYRDSQSVSQDARHTTTSGVRKRSFRVFEQEQVGAIADGKIGQINDWRVLSGPGITTVTWRGSTADPYGQPRNGAALPYLLRKIARRRDLGDWLHNIAWPKVIVEQAIQALIELAVNNPEIGVGMAQDGGDLTPAEWAATQQHILREKLNSLTADDIWMIGEGKAYVINPSDISGLTEILKMERIEEIQALNMLPSLVGVTDGGTQAYAEVQWLAQTQGLGLLSAYCAAAPIQIGNYHLRLLGQDMIVRAEFDDLPPINPQLQAVARQTVVSVEEHLAAIGVNSPEDFAMRVSGGGAADEVRLETYLSALATAVGQLPTNPPAA